MRTYKVTVTQKAPSGEVTEVEMDVLGHSEDSALSTVYGWYDQNTHYLGETSAPILGDYYDGLYDD